LWEANRIAETIAGVLALCARAVSLLARSFDLSRPRGVPPQRAGADDGRLLSRLAGALLRLGAGAARYRVRSAIRTSCAALGVGIPLSVALMLLAAQPVLALPAWQITKTHPGNAIQGENLQFTISVRNAGTTATDGTIVRVVDVLPQGLTLSSVKALGWV